MYAVEFQAPIEDGIVHIPSEYPELYHAKQAQIFIIALDDKQESSFDPKKYFGAANISKQAVDEYLKNTKNEWESSVDAK